MTHLEVENLASDYLEGFLDPSHRKAVDAHLASCAACRETLEDVRRALELCRSAEQVEPAPWLVSKILLATVGERRLTLREQIVAWLRPLLQPRLAYPIAMTVFAFSIIVNAAGLNLRHLRLEDLNPRTWYSRGNRAVHLMTARVEKSYYDLRLVIEIESRLRQLRGQSQDEEEATPKPGAPPGGSSEGQSPGLTQLALAEGPVMMTSALARPVPSSSAQPMRRAGRGRSLYP